MDEGFSARELKEAGDSLQTLMNARFPDLVYAGFSDADYLALKHEIEDSTSKRLNPPKGDTGPSPCIKDIDYDFSSPSRFTPPPFKEVVDTIGRRKAMVTEDGRILGSCYRDLIGSIDKDGYYRDEHGNTVGKMDSEGTVRDYYGTVKFKIDKDEKI